MIFTKKPRMLVVEDEIDFQKMLHSIFKKKCDIQFCLDTDEFFKRFISRVWAVVIVDVDLPNFPVLGHIMVRKAMEARNVFPRTIIISGKKKSNLERIEEEQKTFFQAYIWKGDSGFRGRIMAEVDEAIMSGNNELLRFEEIFTEDGIIGQEVPSNMVNDFNEFGSFEVGLAEKETIGSLIESAKSEKENEEKYKAIMNILRKIMKQHNIDRYERPKK